jgi:hypothetical protein
VVLTAAEWDCLPVGLPQQPSVNTLRVHAKYCCISSTNDTTNRAHQSTHYSPFPKRSRKQVSYLAATETAVVTATKLLDQPEEEIAYIPLPDGFAGTAINPDTKLPAEYREQRNSSNGSHWEQGMCNKIGCLFQGYKDIKGTNTARWIKISEEMPQGHKSTYIQIVVADQPLKAEPRRVRITVRGDKVDYPGEVSTKPLS